MDSPLWFGQFSIAGGQVREEGPYTAFFPARGGEECDLGVVVEAALPGSSSICQELVASLGRRVRRWRLSLTGGLLQALAEAHSYLREWNRRSLPEYRFAVGVSCVACRQGEAYLAQAGPALAFWWQAGRAAGPGGSGTEGVLKRLQPQEESAGPLGLGEELQPTLHRLELAPNGRLLLATTSLAPLADDAQLAALLALAPPTALAALYRLAQPLPEGAALLLAV